MKFYSLPLAIRWSTILNDNNPMRYGVCEASDIECPASSEVYSALDCKKQGDREQWGVWDHVLYCPIVDPVQELARLSLLTGFHLINYTFLVERSRVYSGSELADLIETYFGCKRSADVSFLRSTSQTFSVDN